MIKSQWWLAGFIIVGVLSGVGILILVTRPPKGEAIQLIPPPTPAPITVYVNGGVAKGGLYTLPQGSRVDDAIAAAGGFASDAISTTINLAEILKDGEQVEVPVISSPDVNQNGDQPTYQAPVLVDINSATVEQLDTLPEIGPKTAQNIIDYRSTNGPFLKIEDIMNVPGIGQVTFSKIEDLITLGTSP